MNQEKEMIQISNFALEYLAPRVKVVEIKTRRVMCTSPDGQLGSMTNQEEEW